ncbi:MAG: hypothetical protein ABEH56_08080 [Salinirussus sp.]
MNLPRGSLLRRRVIEDPATPLTDALEADLTGYARLESQDALLLDAEGTGLLTFEAGVPVAAYHTGTDAGGPAALADIAVPGPKRLELYELDGSVLASVHDARDLRVPPGAPAERLAGDPALAERTRSRAPDTRLDEDDDGPGAVEAFLEDEAKIAAIRERAREEARARAEEWDLQP